MADHNHQKNNINESGNNKPRSSKDLISGISDKSTGTVTDRFQTRFTPFRFLIITIGGIFLAEIAAMTILANFRDLPYSLQTLLDASIMVAMISPLIYYFSLRPLLIHIKRLKQAEDELRKSEERFAKAFHFNPAALSITRLNDGCFIHVNESFLTIYNAKREDIIGHTSVELGMFASSDEREKLKLETIKLHLASQPGIRNYEMETHSNSGENLTVLISTEEINLDDEPCILTSVSDITERKRAETRIRKTNRALSVLNGCNQVLVHSENESELIQKMCDVIVNIGGYQMAWVGLAEQDSDKSVRPVAQSGFENSYFELAGTTWANNEIDKGLTGIAIREGLLQVNQSFPGNPTTGMSYDSALLKGYQSNIALPLLNNGSTFGALTIYSASPNAFDLDEQSLLIELANNLAFGITALRVRAERNQAQEQIREMALFPILNPDATLRVDATGLIKMTNPAAKKMGICEDGQLFEIVPDLQELDLPSLISTGSPKQIERETKLNGKTLLWTISGVPDMGCAFLYGKDITERKHAEAAIRQLSSIVEQTEDTVVVTDPQGVIEYVNPAFERLTGYSKEEAIGKTPKLLKSGKHDNVYYRNLWDTISKGNVFQSEIANCKKNGELFYEVKTITPLRDTQGNIISFVATGKNITEHKIDEEKLRKSYDELGIRVQERTAELVDVISKLEKEIVERKQTEEALLKSERSLRKSQEIAHLGSWELDLAEDRLSWSDEVYRIFGLRPDEFDATYNGFLQTVHPDDRAIVNATYANSLQEGRDSFEIEHRIIRKSSGEVRFVYERCEHFRNEAGQVILSVGMVHDISERKQVELSLHFSEKILKQAQAVANLGNWSWSIESGEITLSDEMYRILGIDKDSFTGRLGEAIEKIIHPDDLHLINPNSNQSLLEKKPVEYRIILPDKSIRNIWVKAGEINFDNSGKCIFLTGIAQDITERKQAEEALIKSEERYRSLFNSMTEGFALHEIICDEAGLPINYRFLEINPAFERLTNLKQEDVVGKLVKDVLPDTEPFWIKAYGRVALTGQPAHFENFSAALNRHYEVFVFSPAPHQFAVLFQDVTERKRIDEMIQMQNKELKVAHSVAESESRRLEAIMEALPVGVVITDMYGSTLKSNNAYELIWGRNRPISNHVSYPAWWTETGKPVAPNEWASALVLQKGIPVIGQLMEIRRFDDTHAFIINSAAPIYNSEGAVVGSAVVMQDVTDLHRAEQLLRKAHDELELRVKERTSELAVKNSELINEIKERKEVEQQLRIQSTAMEAAANGIIITDPQGNIQWLNSAITQISGYSAEELLGRNTSIFKSGKQDVDFYSQMWNTILSGHIWKGEVTNRSKQGILYTEDLTITPILDQDNKISHFISIKQDITERKQAEMELERQNMELQALTMAEHKQRQLAEALVKAAMVLNKSLKLDDVLTHILEQINEVIPYQLADIMLLEGKTFYDASHRGELHWPESLPGTKLRFQLDDFPIMKKMAKTGQPILIMNTDSKHDWRPFTGLAWSHSFLSAPLLVDERVIGFVNLFAQQPDFFTQEMCNRLVAFAIHAAAAIQNAWLFDQVRATGERLHGLSQRLVEVQENERRYISRELHDEAGQWLTSLMVDLRLLEKNVSHSAAAKKLIEEMKAALNQVLENLHRVAMALRPASLDHLGLVAALNQHIATIRGKHGLKISFISGNFPNRLPPNVETVLYRIVQEALTNVVRHAHATQAEVVLMERDNKLIVIIEDDGVGFDPNVTIGEEHLGLFGIRERAEMINGELIIESAPGKGTTVVVEVKYDNTFTSS